MLSDNRVRCERSLGHELMTAYHAQEWGTPCHDERRLFEMLVLEGAQAGLNWLVVLKKRERYRLVFDDFDPRKVAAYDEELEQNGTEKVGAWYPTVSPLHACPDPFGAPQRLAATRYRDRVRRAHGCSTRSPARTLGRKDVYRGPTSEETVADPSGEAPPK